MNIIYYIAVLCMPYMLSASASKSIPSSSTAHRKSKSSEDELVVPSDTTRTLLSGESGLDLSDDLRLNMILSCAMQSSSSKRQTYKKLGLVVAAASNDKRFVAEVTTAAPHTVSIWQQNVEGAWELLHTKQQTTPISQVAFLAEASDRVVIRDEVGVSTIYAQSGAYGVKHSDTPRTKPCVVKIVKIATSTALPSGQTAGDHIAYAEREYGRPENIVCAIKNTSDQRIFVQYGISPVVYQIDPQKSLHCEKQYVEGHLCVRLWKEHPSDTSSPDVTYAVDYPNHLHWVYNGDALSPRFNNNVYVRTLKMGPGKRTWPITWKFQESDGVHDLAISPTGNTVVTYIGDGRVNVWERTTSGIPTATYLDELAVLESGAKLIDGVVTSITCHDDATVIVVCNSRVFSFVKKQTGWHYVKASTAPQLPTALIKDAMRVNAEKEILRKRKQAFSPTGNTCALIEDGRVQVHQRTSNDSYTTTFLDELSVLNNGPTLHADDVTRITCPDDHTVIVECKNRAFHFFNLQAGWQYIEGYAASPTGETVAFLCDGRVHVCEPTSDGARNPTYLDELAVLKSGAKLITGDITSITCHDDATVIVVCESRVFPFVKKQTGWRYAEAYTAPQPSGSLSKEALATIASVHIAKATARVQEKTRTTEEQENTQQQAVSDSSGSTSSTKEPKNKRSRRSLRSSGSCAMEAKLDDEASTSNSISNSQQGVTSRS